jgi:hypothetical protein
LTNVWLKCPYLLDPLATPAQQDQVHRLPRRQAGGGGRRPLALSVPDGAGSW